MEHEIKNFIQCYLFIIRSVNMKLKLHLGRMNLVDRFLEFLGDYKMLLTNKTDSRTLRVFL